MGSFSCSSALTSLNTMHLKHIYESARLKSHRVRSNRKPFNNIFPLFQGFRQIRKSSEENGSSWYASFQNFPDLFGYSCVQDFLFYYHLKVTDIGKPLKRTTQVNENGWTTWFQLVRYVCFCRKHKRTANNSLSPDVV